MTPEIEKAIKTMDQLASEVDQRVPDPSVGTATRWELLKSRIKWEWYQLKELFK